MAVSSTAESADAGRVEMSTAGSGLELGDDLSELLDAVVSPALEFIQQQNPSKDTTNSSAAASASSTTGIKGMARKTKPRKSPLQTEIPVKKLPPTGPKKRGGWKRRKVDEANSSSGSPQMPPAPPPPTIVPNSAVSNFLVSCFNQMSETDQAKLGLVLMRAGFQRLSALVNE